MTAIERKKFPFTGHHPDLMGLLEEFPFALSPTTEAHFIRIEETEEDGAYVVRAELPGIDPDKDVEVTLERGVLTIQAERSEERKDKQRSEFRYGAFTRTITLPEGVQEEDVAADYENGILTVRAPMRETTTTTRRIRVGSKGD